MSPASTSYAINETYQCRSNLQHLCKTSDIYRHFCSRDTILLNCTFACRQPCQGSESHAHPGRFGSCWKSRQISKTPTSTNIDSSVSC